MTQTISVIIVNWNGAGVLPRCLSALSAQTRPPDEIILADNASRDDSVAWVRAHHPNVRLIELDQNLGFAAANNLAAKASTSEWLALLNPDAFPEPGWLAAFAGAIRAHPDIISFTGLLTDAENPGVLDGSGDLYHSSGLAWRRSHGAADDAVARARMQAPIFSACGASALYRRDAFLEIGGFDEDFFCYLEDVDLGFRLLLQGHECRLVPTAVARHVGSATTGRRSPFSIYHGHRNLTWAYLKNMPGILFWLYLPQHLAMSLVALAWYTLKGRGGTIWKAKLDALRGVPAQLKKRRRIQRQRTISSGELRRYLVRGIREIRR